MVTVAVRLGRALVVAVLFGAATASAQQSSTAVQKVLILSKNDRVLSMVDPVTLKIVGRVPAGPDPHEVVSSTDG